jgi:hypothetical protein
MGKGTLETAWADDQDAICDFIAECMNNGDDMNKTKEELAELDAKLKYAGFRRNGPLVYNDFIPELVAGGGLAVEAFQKGKMSSGQVVNYLSKRSRGTNDFC